jgi:hypothetical protein
MSGSSKPKSLILYEYCSFYRLDILTFYEAIIYLT